MDISNENMLNTESSDDTTIASKVVKNLSYIDSPTEDNLSNLNGFDLPNNKPQLNVHTPSPMVTRSYFNDHKEPWKNMSIYSYSRCSDIVEYEGTGNSSQRSIDDVYNVHIDTKLPLTHNWVNYQPSYSPESKRDTDIIFEEKTVNETNGDLENSDYSDQSQSPENSISSNDSTSSSSSDSSQEDIAPVTEGRPQENTHTYRISLEQCRDFQEIFSGINDEELSGKRYHQPPKALDREAAKRLARRLYECDGFKITDVAKHLSKRNDFSQIVGEEFANFFDFTDLRLDKALRLFLGRFTLTGETQERERIMHHFSKRYVACNPNMYKCEDACHTLVCALIILNTNIHSQNQPKMLCTDFVLNLKDLNDGDNFPVDNLKDLYSAIEQEPIRWPMDDELVGIVNVPKQELHDFSKQMVNPNYSIGLDLPRDSNCRDFMSGYVVRKWLKETGGRKAAFGKRGWKLFYGRLRDLTLYLYKDHDKSVTQSVNTSQPNPISVAKKKSFKTAPGKQAKDSDSTSTNGHQSANPESQSMSTPVQSNGDHTMSSADTDQVSDSAVQSNEDSKEPMTPPEIPHTNNSVPITDGPKPNLVLPPADAEIHINHAFASRALDYVKKKNIFRIKTKYGSEYLFQVNTEKEMDGWIDNVNYVAALLSDPEPTIGICTMEKLSARSIPLPKITMLNVRDQLESHQKCVLELERVIASLRESTPRRLDKRARSELEESIKFREDELLRYKTYCQLLEFELVRMQNMVNLRMAGVEGLSSASFFYPSFPLAGSSPAAAAYFMNNQGMIVNQQMMNPSFTMQALVPPPSSSSSSSDNYNMCYRAPILQQQHTQSSMNRRLRYRVGQGSLVQSYPSVVASQASPTQVPGPATSTSIISAMVATPPGVTMDTGGATTTTDNTYTGPATVSTFYEIV